jgi:hypothetical protein
MLNHFTRPQLAWIALVFVAVYTFAFALCFPSWQRYDRLSREGVQTSGSVTRKEPENHASIAYNYTVDGMDYETTANTGYAGIPPLDQIRIGRVSQLPIGHLVHGSRHPETLVNNGRSFLARFSAYPLPWPYFLQLALPCRWETRGQRLPHI